MNKCYNLKISQIQQEIDEAVIITFNIPYELQELFLFYPGQYITLDLTIKDKNYRRCYSICSSNNDLSSISIGVKRVKNGIVSNYINDTFKVGDTVKVLVPDGRFYAATTKENYKSYYLFAAGSGITPIYAILQSVLYTEPESFVYLLYGNTHQESILFKNDLEKLQQSFPNRLVVVHSLSKPKSEWSDLWTSTKDKAYITGRITTEHINWFINEYPPYAQNTEYYICGPGNMIDTVRTSLTNIDVPASRIFFESFGTPQNQLGTEGITANLTATTKTETINTIVNHNETLLVALKSKSKAIPYSCEAGICGQCKCKLTQGKVSMKNNLYLTDKEIIEGYILSCQAVAKTQEITITFS